MRKLPVIVLTTLALLWLGAKAPQGKSHHYWVEYNREIKGNEGIETLDVCFGDAISKEKAARALRRELETIVETFDPKIDIMTTAWDYSGEERQILPRDETLIYLAKEKRIVTWKDRPKK